MFDKLNSLQVLQEVAAARHLSIVCGSCEIDSYSFSSGVNALEWVYAKHPEVGNSIWPMVHLMQCTPPLLGPVHVGEGSDFSLDIHCLGDLIDMYRLREATDRRDKIYALLGMCSDRRLVNLLPDYEISWTALLCKAATALFGRHIQVMAWNDKEVAVISAQCWLRGKVTAIRNESRGQLVLISPARVMDDAIQYLHLGVEPIRKGDILCYIAGGYAGKQAILRVLGDYYFVIAAAIDVPGLESYDEWRRSSRLYNATIIWDWEGWRPDGGCEHSLYQFLGSRIPMWEKEYSSDCVSWLIWEKEWSPYHDPWGFFRLPDYIYGAVQPQEMEHPAVERYQATEAMRYAVNM